MFQLFRKGLQKPISSIRAILNPPQHIRLHALGASLGNCLRALEEKAELPQGDLYTKGEPMKVASWPLGLRSLRHPVFSKTSDSQKTDPSKTGYIAGHVLETSRVDGDSNNFFGSLHISKNCPGVYRDNVCTTCGDISI